MVTIGGRVHGAVEHSGRVSALSVLVLTGVLAVADAASVEAQSPTCQFRGTPQALAERPSPLDSVTIRLGDTAAKLCYGAPSARGRAMLGDQEPWGVPWRLGANEPTTLHLPVDADIGGVAVGPGAYSLYAIPNPGSWTIVVNANTNRWGIPISADVRAADLGSFTVRVAGLEQPVETLEFAFEPSGEAGGDLVYRWERATFRVPIRRR
jgi:hypothetical protein